MSAESEFLKTLDEQEGIQSASYQFEPDLDAPFPLDCLPDVLRETVEEYARVKMAPIELTAAFAIGCHSVSLAKGVTIMTNYGEPTIQTFRFTDRHGRVSARAYAFYCKGPLMSLKRNPGKSFVCRSSRKSGNSDHRTKPVRSL